MKNLFFVAVPFVALLTACPIGPGGVEGEGEGEGEGEPPFEGTLDMTFPEMMSAVSVNGAPCLDQPSDVHTYELTEPGDYDVEVAPLDTGRRCVDKRIEVELPGAQLVDYGVKGACGQFANGAYDEPNEGIVVNVTTINTGTQLLISDDALLPPFDLVVFDEIDEEGVVQKKFHGQSDDFSSTGTYSNGNCVINIHQEGNGLAGDFILLSRDPSCAG